MEGLTQLVAAAFVRHGLESPVQDKSPALATVHSAEPALPAALPEHNYRKTTQAEIVSP
jgi:hypothetical protein